MGANYAEAALRDYPELPHAAMRMFVRMALATIDGKPNPSYWGGWQTLAHGLGCNMPEADDASDYAANLRRNAQRAIERHIAVLVEAGAITRLKSGRPRQNAEYRLNLNPVDKATLYGPTPDAERGA